MGQEGGGDGSGGARVEGWGGNGCGRWGKYCCGDGIQDARCRSEKRFCDG